MGVKLGVKVRPKADYSLDQIYVPVLQVQVHNYVAGRIGTSRASRDQTDVVRASDFEVRWV